MVETPRRSYAVFRHDTAGYRTAALKSGAAGLISKNDFATAIPELLAALACGRLQTDHVFCSVSRELMK